jgi:hypothetical protein
MRSDLASMGSRNPENYTDSGTEKIRQRHHDFNRGQKKSKAFSYDTLAGGKGKFSREKLGLGKYAAMKRRKGM